MADYVDEQKIGTGLTQRALDRVLSAAEGAARERIAKSRNKSQGLLAEYIVAKRALLSRVRNNLYFSTPINISEIYVETHLIPSQRVGGARSLFPESFYEHIGDDAFREKLTSHIDKEDHRPYPACNIHGIAGLGKSLFMRNLFLSLSGGEEKFVPIFIELRDLNRAVPGSIENAIENELERFGAKLMSEQIKDGLENGLFVLLLDGFDELRVVLQSHYEQEVEIFSSRYQRCPIVISGRPIESKYAWRQFEAFDIAPLDRGRARRLVERLAFDSSVKNEFLRQLDQKWFDENREFAEIPLLLNVMLIAFSQIGNISPRRHEFIEDAFNALWSRHDAAKDTFSRQRLLDVGKTDFLQIICALAASTYADEEIEFDERSLFRHMKIAIDIYDPEHTIDLDDLRDDLLITTCLIVKEGLNYKFLHRYFQEFFTALYVSKLFDRIQESIEEISLRYESDNVLQLLLSIDSEKLERGWVIPKYRSVSKKFNIEKAGFKGYWDTLIGESDWSGLVDFNLRRWPGRFFDILRVVYGMKPGLAEIESAMSMLSGGDFEPDELPLIDINDEMDNPLHRDYRNQVELRRRILRKYEGRMKTRAVLFGDSKEGQSPK